MERKGCTIKKKAKSTSVSGSHFCLSHLIVSLLYLSFFFFLFIYLFVCLSCSVPILLKDALPLTKLFVLKDTLLNPSTYKCNMLLLVVESRRLHLASPLTCLKNTLLGPPKVCSKLTKNSEFTVGCKTQCTESLGDHNTLLSVIRGRDPIEHTETLQGLHPTSGLVRKHTTNSTLENFGWATLVIGATTRVGVALLVQEGTELDLVAENYKVQKVNARH